MASKAEILDHVWGIDFAGDPNVVEVYVGLPAQEDRRSRSASSRSRPCAARATNSFPMSDEETPTAEAVVAAVGPRSASPSSPRSRSRSPSARPRSVSCGSCTTTSSTGSRRPTSTARRAAGRDPTRRRATPADANAMCGYDGRPGGCVCYSDPPRTRRLRGRATRDPDDRRQHHARRAAVDRRTSTARSTR